MAAGEDDLDAAALLADLQDGGPDALVHAVLLAGDHLAAGQDRLGVAEVDGGHAVVDAGDGAGDDLAADGLVLVVQLVPLRLADLLDHHLLGGLGGDAAQQFAQLVLVELFSLDGGGDVAVLAVDLDVDLGLFAVVLLGGGDDGLLDGAEDQFLRDALVSVHAVDDAKDFGAVHRFRLAGGRSRAMRGVRGASRAVRG